MKNNDELGAEHYIKFGKMQLDIVLKRLLNQRKDLPEWVNKYLYVQLDRAVRHFEDKDVSMIEIGSFRVFSVMNILDMFDGKCFLDEYGHTHDLDRYIKTREIKSIYNKKGDKRD